MSSQAFFDLSKWHGVLIFAPSEHQEFDRFLRDKEHVYQYLRSTLRQQTFDEEKGLLEPMPLEQSLLDHYWRSFEFRRQHYANLMLVTVAAYLESIVFDFFHVFFLHKNKSMHDFIGRDEEKGYIRLDDVLVSKSLDELVGRLAARAATAAAAGSPKDIQKRLKKLLGQGLPDNLLESFEQLVISRNIIAHEAKMLPDGQLDVSGSYDTVLQILKYFGRVAIDKSIPISDAGRLLDD